MQGQRHGHSGGRAGFSYIATQDFDIINDLRELDGRPKDKSFDDFLSKIKFFLESHARVEI